MPSKPNVHVTPHVDGWQVKHAGASRASSVHATKAAAVEQGTATAKLERVELLIHDKEGRITERNSFGSDPFPPRG